jgi:methylated-DNA-[protein]-cysteine S-methyltransferase
MAYALNRHATPIGTLILIGNDRKLCGVIYGPMWQRFERDFGSAVERETPVLTRTRGQLDQYFAGRRRTFDLPMELRGTPFQIRAWHALDAIPFGETRTYGEQATVIRAPKAFRAVGRANGLNPISIVLPCHRVIGSDGTLTGYGGGLAAKRFLLAHEGVDLT